MAFLFSSAAGAAPATWTTIVENTTASSLELVRLGVFATAGGAGAALRLVTDGGATYQLLGGASTTASLADGTGLSGLPALALEFGDRLEFRSVAVNYWADRSIQSDYGVGAVFPVRVNVAAGAGWTDLVGAATTGSRLVTQQWIANGGSSSATVQLRLGGVAGNPVIARATLVPNGVIAALPDVGLPTGSTLQISSTNPVSFVALGSDRP